MVGLSGAGSSVAEAFLRRPRWGRGWCVPATTRRVQAVSRPRRWWRGSRRFRARVESCPSCSRRLGEATDLAVAQAVVDERKHFAGDGDGGFVFAAPLGDLAPVGCELAAAVVTD